MVEDALRGEHQTRTQGDQAQWDTTVSERQTQRTVLILFRSIQLPCAQISARRDGALRTSIAARSALHAQL